VVKADSEIRRVALFKNGYLRLLMTLVGFQRIGLEDDPDATWVVPSTMSADQIKETLDLIKKFEFSPPVFDDGKEAGDFIRRKSAGSAAHRRAAFDDEDDGIDDDEEKPLFPAGGPTARKKSADALETLKKNRRRRRREGTDEEDTGITDEQREARAAARRKRELEKNRKIKSELFIGDSDDDEEADRIFFEQEEKLRQANKINIMKELLGVEKAKEKEAQTKKRQSSAISGDSDEDDIQPSTGRKRQTSTVSIDSDDEAAEASGHSSPTGRDSILAASEEDATDTPMSSPHARSSQTKRQKLSSDPEMALSESPSLGKDLPSGDAMSGDEDDDAAPVSRPARQRVRAGFIVDSSDDE
jgi:replication fork protection complex subunit Tof1/Swi1